MSELQFGHLFVDMTGIGTVEQYDANYGDGAYQRDLEAQARSNRASMFSIDDDGSISRPGPFGNDTVSYGEMCKEIDSE